MWLGFLWRFGRVQLPRVGRKVNKFQLIRILAEEYQKGTNITEFLRNMRGVDENSSEAIEIAYDLQAGNYIRFLHDHWESSLEHNREIVGHLSHHLDSETTFLDAGAGEFTNLTLSFQNSQLDAKKILACDISWSRVSKGVGYWHTNNPSSSIEMVPFVADFKHLPFAENSIDVVSTRHAIEPNGGSLDECLLSLFRVARKKVILFEPHYELAGAEGQKRMDKFGYVRGIEEAIGRLGATLLDVTPFKTNYNNLNPVSCFVVEPPSKAASDPITQSTSVEGFTVPGTDFPLVKKNGFLVSEDTGYVFPILEKIPCLTHANAILATAYAR
jgi:ubiquinone/menaquinone biosynthesis C-methylase UbiE